MPIEYAQIISTIDQRPESTEPVPVFMDQNDQISGIEHSTEHPGDIRISESGVYVLIAAPQVGRVSGNGPGHVDFWLRKNGEDIPNSNVRCTIKNDDDKDVVVNQTMSAFKKGDVLNIMMAVDKAGEGLGIEAIKTPNRPLIPSIIFSMHKIKESTDGHWISTQKGTKKLWVEN
ncbi:MAG: hypothetical protein H2B05_08455 [Nitrosopumilaceae archaeon]|jgi:hypothetical protein|uniref:Uncharacterized protein n=3 Tax=Candidatus Nitrosomaritimum aestuariumsis TaxID=3342354 RepID=A0AC60W9U3_9ARCH|nr:hypothetical protein [Nitrosopumilaceae archaeon]MBA4454947.1 hypothetical protein [Nitrosopumilaceae archaeon]MBA4459408.1 hypothetical protein [Nitrosopumilaceae archaeon]MBA4462434.1 hypothetical protein [Nitrosopumilaceae archaeon]MBA4463551.1 hypothetical protein [Nitrosopumilaceae archaeon]